MHREDSVSREDQCIHLPDQCTCRRLHLVRKNKKMSLQSLKSANRLKMRQVACLTSSWIVPVRHRTRINPPKATKKGRLLLKDQKRLKLKEEYKQDPQKMLTETLKKSGIKLCPPFTERAVTITCTGDIFEPYVPPEGDGKAMSLTPEGAKQRLERAKNIGVTQLHQRKIRQFEPEFTASEFAWKAQKIFIDAHNALQDFDKNILHRLVTERAYPTLAIYDRFGRLMLGSEDIPKDVLEYVVFEKHLSGLYGSWRIHGKIVPAWAASLEPIVKTVIIQASEDTELTMQDR
ncbi:39S ribosomal protein L45, mitochondrial-like isoform X3 [Acanthaster planci]|uniref:Large ribosomal subunit protein mL45 n=1 Tax=Acanthaster planci TaxID=133434 RepID=A0A8B7ZZ70_ACAPL|nr:39S ribosomal protein L45, mitochondrial-like isoform X3 [Acanthaster planci]